MACHPLIVATTSDALLALFYKKIDEWPSLKKNKKVKCTHLTLRLHTCLTISF
jgi:hypothetical protein